MAAVATAPAGLGADDAARLLAPPPVEDVQFYSALTPRDSLPLLAVSGVTGKAFWIGSLPQPPDEEEETDDESDGEESEEEHELDAEGAAVQEFKIAKLREERREEAEAMYRMWKEAPEQWLLKSKIGWSTRHESRRAPARTAAPSVARPGAPHASGKASGGGGRTTNTSKRASTGSGTPGGGIAAPGRSAVSLKMLVAAGLMRPGPEALWITYLDQTWHGALDAAGAIAFQDQTFYSPSAWAIHCKRLANPGKKADDGWKSVRYGSAEGPTLHDVKLAFLAGVGRGTPGSAGRAPSDGAKAQQSLGFARQELPASSAGESPASDRKRRTGLVSGVSSPDAAAELFSSRGDEGQKAAPAPRATPAKRPREGEVEGELENRSAKKPSAPSATDMSWLAAFADPADAEGAAERDARFAAAAPGGDHASLLGRTVQVFWPSEETWHAGRVLRVEPGAGGASVLYATGDVEQGVVLDALAEKGHLFVL